MTDDEKRELIGELREYSTEVDWYHTRGAELMRQSADALEELHAESGWLYGVVDQSDSTNVIPMPKQRIAQYKASGWTIAAVRRRNIGRPWEEVPSE